MCPFNDLLEIEEWDGLHFQNQEAEHPKDKHLETANLDSYISAYFQHYGFIINTEIDEKLNIDSDYSHLG